MEQSASSSPSQSERPSWRSRFARALPVAILGFVIGTAVTVVAHGRVWGSVLEVTKADVQDMSERLEGLRASTELTGEKRQRALASLARQCELSLRVVDPTRSPVLLNKLIAKDPVYRDALVNSLQTFSPSSNDPRDLAFELNRIRQTALDLMAKAPVATDSIAVEPPPEP